MSLMPLMMRKRMSIHSQLLQTSIICQQQSLLVTVMLVLRPAPHLKQFEEQEINILAASHGKSSISYFGKTNKIVPKP